VDGLLGYTTGFAVPQYVITTKLGKIPITKEVVTQVDDGYCVTNYEGHTAHIGDIPMKDMTDNAH
jgi:lysine 2,3-aminomutase